MVDDDSRRHSGFNFSFHRDRGADVFWQRCLASPKDPFIISRELHRLLRSSSVCPFSCDSDIYHGEINDGDAASVSATIAAAFESELFSSLQRGAA